MRKTGFQILVVSGYPSLRNGDGARLFIVRYYTLDLGFDARSAFLDRPEARPCHRPGSIEACVLQNAHGVLRNAQRARMRHL